MFKWLMCQYCIHCSDACGEIHQKHSCINADKQLLLMITPFPKMKSRRVDPEVLWLISKLFFSFLLIMFEHSRQSLSSFFNLFAEPQESSVKVSCYIVYTWIMHLSVRRRKSVWRVTCRWRDRKLWSWVRIHLSLWYYFEICHHQIRGFLLKTSKTCITSDLPPKSSLYAVM